MKKMLTVIIALCLSALHLWALAPVSSETMAVYSNAARQVTASMPRRHLQKEVLNDSLAREAVDILLNSLDYDHTFFLRSDVDRFKRESDKLDDQMQKGKLQFAFDVYETYMQRVSNRVDYVDKLLDKGFDLETDEDYVWKRKDSNWAASRDEWDELWRKKIKNQYIGHRVGNVLDEEDGENGEDPDSQEKKTAEVENDETAESKESGDDTDRSLVAETPEESIRNQYDQLLTVMSDNDAHWLLTRYITSFTRAMDPHSDFMSQRDIEDFNISMKKSLEGIGALLRTEDGAAKIVRLIPGGPAEQDGRLKPNDKIVAVAQGEDEEPVDIRHWPLSRAVRKIRGEKGSKIVLSVIPASDITDTKIEEITLVRDEVKLEEQVAKGKVEEVEADDGANYKIGLITIPDFYADMEAMRKGQEDARSVTKDVREILEGFESTNQVDGIILDLRNNGGGALNEAVDLTGLFINSGPVVQVKSRSGAPKKLYDGDPEQVYGGPLVILVNRLSASASEILAAALQDYERAVVVGDSKTHGKGTVQALLPLEAEAAGKELGSLKVTTAGFYRIAGESTQLQGVEPDIVIPSLLDYMEVGEEYQPHALELSAIKPAFYWAEGDLDKLISDLRRRSREHREEDEQFQEYIKLVEHIGQRRESESVSLNLESRLDSARKERRMQDLALDMDVPEETLGAMDADPPADEEQENGEAEEETESDPVLKETLRVIADLIELQDEGESKESSSVARKE